MPYKDKKKEIENRRRYYQKNKELFKQKYREKRDIRNSFKLIFGGDVYY